MRKRQIDSIQFDEDGVTINYIEPESDVRGQGIVHLHTLMIPSTADYADEMRDVLAAAEYLLGDALDDWERLDPARPENAPPPPEETGDGDDDGE